MSADRARSSVRFSLGKQTTDADIEFALERVPEVVERLRELSPVWKRAVSTQHSAFSD
jgi:cysteine desulfurase